MQRLFDLFEQEGWELYLVGGAVRELARGISMDRIDDLDFCTNARPQTTLAILKGAGLTTYDVGIEFGTVGAVLQGDKERGYPKDCQITTYRSAEYYRRGSRHPQVRYGDTIDQDLRRRDFSINSIAMDGRGQYVDPYNGLGDLERGVLRVVSDPHETLAEDPLRILRIGRFIAKLGFEADPELRHAARARATHILDISHERWLQEMSKLLCGPHVREGLAFLHDVGILGVILPEVACLANGPPRCEGAWAHTLDVLERVEPEPSQRWGALLHDIGKPWTAQQGDDGDEPSFDRHELHGAMLCEGIASRFRFDNDMARRVEAIALHHGPITAYRSSWSEAQIRRLVRELDPHCEDLLRFGRANARSDQETARVDELIARVRHLEQARALRPSLPSRFGKDLMSAFSLPPSPRIGQLMDQLRDAMIEGELAMHLSSPEYIAWLRAHAIDEELDA